MIKLYSQGGEKFEWGQRVYFRRLQDTQLERFRSANCGVQSSTIMLALDQSVATLPAICLAIWLAVLLCKQSGHLILCAATSYLVPAATEITRLERLLE